MNLRETIAELRQLDHERRTGVGIDGAAAADALDALLRLTFRDLLRAAESWCEVLDLHDGTKPASYSFASDISDVVHAYREGKKS